MEKFNGFKVLFLEDDIEEVEQESKVPQYDKLIMPEVLVSLEAPDEFLRDRVMNLPEKLIEGTHNTEDKLNRRLTVFRENNAEDVSVLNYFDELEVHPHVIGQLCYITHYVTLKYIGTSAIGRCSNCIIYTV